MRAPIHSLPKAGSLNRSHIFSLAAVAALVLLIGCGGDDNGDSTEPGQLSGEEFSQQLEEVDRQVSRAFGQVFQSGVDELEPNEQVPEAVKEAIRAAADVEREAADQLDELEPPEDAREAVDGLVQTAREQADTLSQAAEQEDLTARELEQAFQEQNPEQYLRELEELGYLPSQGGEGEGGGGEAEADNAEGGGGAE